MAKRLHYENFAKNAKVKRIGGKRDRRALKHFFNHGSPLANISSPMKKPKRPK